MKNTSVNMRNGKYKVLLLSISLFAEILFFSYNLITGTTYLGAETSNRYMLFIAITDLIPLYYFLRLLIDGKLDRRIFGLLLVFGLIFFSYYLSEINNVNKDLLIKPFVAYSVPAALCGIIIAKDHSIEDLIKWLEPLMLILTVVSFYSMRTILNVSLLEVGNDQGIGVQSISYYGAFAFSINLYFLLFGESDVKRFSYTKHNLYRYLSMFMGVLQVVTILSSGGRGGFILLVANVVVLLFFRFKYASIKKGRLFNMFFVSAIVILVAIMFMPSNIQNAIFSGAERTFSYLTKSGIDMSETSNRDDVYSFALKCIDGSPVFGYGMFEYLNTFSIGYPHNIFLEWLLQGGIIMCFLCTILLIKLFVKLYEMLNSSHSIGIIPLVLYPIVMLMFSASYLGTSFFWFVIAYIYVYKSKKQII